MISYKDEVVGVFVEFKDGHFQSRPVTRGEMYKDSEPKQKVIKLDEIVGTDIDCEFSNFASSIDDDDSERLWYTSQLINIHHNGNYMYPNGCAERCRIRQDHWFYEPHGWGKCPIPDGLEVVLRSKYGGEETTNVYVNRDNWKHGGDETIIAFQVISTADDARYEWEKENGTNN